MGESADHSLFETSLVGLAPSERTARVLDAARGLGFAHVGVCSAEPVDRREQQAGWIEAGKHGEMSYLSDRVDEMLDPAAVLEGARSIICVADRYAVTGGDPGSGGPRGRVARYARGRDYHDVLRRRLRLLATAVEDHAPGHRARGVVDTAPLMEREHALRAGLGLIGKNTLMIRPGEGSWMVLGEVLTTLELEPGPNPEWAGRSDPCGSCTRCIDACPTDAIEPFSIDATRCISYQTIEHRSRIEPDGFRAIGDWIFGCDICQEVCPHNLPQRRTSSLPVLDPYRPRRDGFDLLEVLAWDEADRREAFTTSSLKRAKLETFKRNAVICAGNILERESHPALLARIEELADDPSEGLLVQDTARAVLDRLSGTSRPG